jgi:hypothetical protein
VGAVVFDAVVLGVEAVERRRMLVTDLDVDFSVAVAECVARDAVAVYDVADSAYVVRFRHSQPSSSATS